LIYQKNRRILGGNEQQLTEGKSRTPAFPTHGRRNAGFAQCESNWRSNSGEEGLPGCRNSQRAYPLLGYEDGEKIKRSTLIDLTGRIAHSVQVPITADIEAGYGASLSELEETAHLVVESGVAGVNIEDSLKEGSDLRPVDEQCERIATLRQVADRHGVHLGSMPGWIASFHPVSRISNRQ
jgi:hypothetical protein